MNNINSKFILTCPNCGAKQIYVGTGLYTNPICCRCNSDMKACMTQTLDEEIVTIRNSDELCREFGYTIRNILENNLVVNEYLGKLVCDAYHNGSKEAEDMFCALTGLNLADVIACMEPVPVKTEKKEAAE